MVNEKRMNAGRITDAKNAFVWAVGGV